MEINKITHDIIGSAIDIHRELGPGLLESAYEECLAYELTEKGYQVEKQKVLPLKYKKVSLDCGYRIDLLINGKIIVELKSVKSVEPIHKAQLMSYLKISGLKCGLLINFNVKLLKKGVIRIVL